MVDKPFPAYEDAGEYFFVSYSHDDTDLVYPEMAWLREAGFNLWYDDGIHVGTVWRRALADALSRSSGMVFFCTQKSIESDICLKEINFALDDAKPVFVVQLDETPLPAELRLSLSDRQALRRTEFDDHTYRSRLTAALSAIVTPEVPETGAPQGERRAEMDPPSIAVLPITSISDDREVQLIAEALSEDMITHVSMVPWRTSAALASDAGRDPREIGRDRDVRYVLDGSIRPRADGYRVTTKLAETEHGSQLWVQRYDISQTDLDDAQDKLVVDVTWSVFEAVTQAEGVRLRDTPIDELDAWGLFALARDTPLVNAAARDHVLNLLRRGVEHDPEFGPAHAWLAFQLAVVVNTQFSRRPEEDQRDAITHADRALALMPNNPGIMSMAGYPHRLFGSETLAIELSERTHEMVGRGSWFTFSTFIQAGRSAEVLDMAANTPLAGTDYACVAHAELLNGVCENALDYTQKWVGAESGNYLAWIALANVLAMLDRATEAHEAWDRAKKMVPTLTLALYEKGTRASWRDREAIAGPLYQGLRTLGLE